MNPFDVIQKIRKVHRAIHLGRIPISGRARHLRRDNVVIAKRANLRWETYQVGVEMGTCLGAFQLGGVQQFTNPSAALTCKGSSYSTNMKRQALLELLLRPCSRQNILARICVYKGALKLML